MYSSYCIQVFMAKELKSVRYVWLNGKRFQFAILCNWSLFCDDYWACIEKNDEPKDFHFLTTSFTFYA